MKNIQKQFRSLKHVAPDPQKKAAFRHTLEQRVRADMHLRSTRNAIHAIGWIGFFRYIFHAPAFALAIVIIIIGSGSGITFAAQNAIPGNLLYTVKLGTEKARLVITPNEQKKAELHIEFASRRMHEIEQLISTDTVSDTFVTDVVSRYENELNEGEKLLQKNPGATQNITSLITATESHKNTIKQLREKIAERSDDHLSARLDEAYEHAESQSDAALLSAFSRVATSSASMEISEKIIRTSREKVRALEDDIHERQRAIETARQEPDRNDDAITEATKKLEAAREMVNTAKDRFENKDYRESVERTIKARELIKETSSWNKKKDSKEKDDSSERKDEDNDTRKDDDSQKREREHD